MITIVDSATANIGSICNMLSYLRVSFRLAASVDDIMSAEKLLLPGVGAFDSMMGQLNRGGLTDALNQRVLVEKVPILGICLGLQVMCRGSEEGNLEGLGWIDAEVKKFNFDRLDRKSAIPHMGWNDIRLSKWHPVTESLPERPRFYFVHSFHAIANRHRDVLAETEYGYIFASALARDNIIGVQFHPEKSHAFGMKLLQSFGAWKYE